MNVMDWQSKRVLVTGGAGFIGSHLSAKLLELGADVTVLDDSPAGDSAEVLSGANFIEGCIADSATRSSALEGVDAVFHLAAIASVPLCEAEPERSDMVNRQASLGILLEANCPVIFASSAAIYGEPVTIPIYENHPLAPVGHYGEQKVVVDEAICSLDESSNPATALRFFNVFGRGQDPSSQYSGVLSIFIDRATSNRPITIIGDGEQTRDFIHVSDVIAALIICGQSLLEQGTASPAHGESFNVCTGQPVTLNQVVKVIEDCIEHKLDIVYDEAREGDIKHSSGDSTKLQQNFDWSPNFTLSEGISDLISHSN
jgi:UDP-glucose 4-epimerase